MQVEKSNHFYMFMLLVQSSLIFNRAHLNRWGTFLLYGIYLIVHRMIDVFKRPAQIKAGTD